MRGWNRPVERPPSCRTCSRLPVLIQLGQSGKVPMRLDTLIHSFEVSPPQVDG
jgi:hypothetical protein